MTSSWTQVLFEAIDDAVFVHDEQGNILDANSAASRRLGYTHDELLRLNTRVNEFPLARCVRGESFDDLELFVRHRGAPDGLWINVAGRPLLERDGKIKGGVLVCKDITEHQRVEQELRDSRAIYESLVEGL